MSLALRLAGFLAAGFLLYNGLNGLQTGTVYSGYVSVRREQGAIFYICVAISLAGSAAAMVAAIVGR